MGKIIASVKGRIDAMRGIHVFLGAIATGVLASRTLTPALAQVTSDGTTNTTVNTIGNNSTILNGIERGNNLFHSFSNFSVPNGGSASFDLTNTPNITTIFSRVTGGNISDINGLIQTLNGNNPASLFLINPAGIVFGENASLNIGGSFVGTTANSIQFTDGTEFSAVNPTANPLLTMSVPVGLQMRSNPGNIQVNGVGHTLEYGPGAQSTGRLLNVSENTGLEVNNGQTLGLVGGNINLSGGILRTNGHIELGSVGRGNANNSFVHLTPTTSGWKFNYDSLVSMGTIEFDQKAMAASTGTGGNSIQIQAQKLFFQGRSALVLQNTGDLPVGNIHIQARESIETIGTIGSGIPNSILTDSLGAGNGANISIQTPHFFMGQGGGNLSARSFGTGNGGNITIDASRVELIGETSSGVISTRVVGLGNGGDITINTDRFRSQNGGGIFANVNGGSGQGGKVLINATEFIEMSRPNPLSDRNSIGSSAVTGTGNAGSITLNTGRLSVLDGTRVSTSTFGFGNAGQLTVNADFVEVNGFYDNSTTPSPGSIRAGAFQLDPIARRIFNLPDFPTGNAGSVTINARNINITDRGQVTVQNDGMGDAGDLKINADSLLIRNDAGITASTASGEGGNIGFYLQDSLVMRDGSFISATAGGTGNGGNINISSPVIVGLENSDIIANAFQGNGGNINITTQGLFGLTLRDSLTRGSDITASSQFGVSGTVDIKNFGIDPSSGLAELSVKLADTSEQIATACADTSGSSFIATGRGGIPENPNQQVNANRTWSDIRDLSAYRQTQVVTAQSPEILVQATSWRRNADGKLELVADKSPSYLPQQPTCSVANM